MTTPRPRYMAFDIGCIECGQDSAVIGLYTSEKKAEAACEEWEAVGWRGGQHHYQVFDLDKTVGLPI